MPRADFFRGALFLAALASVVACHRGRGATGTASAAQSAAPAPAAPTLPNGVTLAMISLGDSLFNNRSCVRCHGANGVGGANGPTLTNKAKWDHGSGSYEDIVKTVTTGVPKEAVKDATRQFAMRARGGMQPLLDDAQVAAVAAYVWSLNHPVK